MAHTCHPTVTEAWEADPWGTQVSQIEYWTSPMPVRDTVSKYNINSTQKDDTLVCLYIHVHIRTCTHACECTQTNQMPSLSLKECCSRKDRLISSVPSAIYPLRSFQCVPCSWMWKKIRHGGLVPCRVAWALLSLDHAPSAYLSHMSKGLEDGKLWGLPAPTG